MGLGVVPARSPLILIFVIRDLQEPILGESCESRGQEQTPYP